MNEKDPERRRPGRPRGGGVVDDDELIDRALSMLAHGGYGALSMRGLARELGVSLASVQHRYATKDRLWRGAVDRLVDDDSSRRSDAGTFQDVLRERISVAARYPGLMSSLLADDGPGGEERLAYLARKLAPSFDSARSTLQDATTGGLTREVDADVLITMMLVGVGAVGAVSPAIRQILGLGERDDERLSAGIADLLLFGVVAR